ncbi:DUF885 domain-containing protein [Cytophagaceae bacterium ABcell3]|nr:DUF885 domain-containing protein [Cytophagaceae bacterium ABcell3]
MKYIFLALMAGILVSCAGSTGKEVVFSQEEIDEESERLNEFFEKRFNEGVERSPQYQSRLGIKKDYDKWDDISDEHELEEFEISKRNNQIMRDSFNFEKLNRQAQISYRLSDYNFKMREEGMQWRFHNYPVNQLFGLHSSAPSFLINVHRIDSIPDAEDYIARLEGMEPLFEQFMEKVKVREEKDIMPPKFVYERVINDCKSLLQGVPFDDSDKPSSLWKDFTSKVESLDISSEEEERLLAEGRSALTGKVQPVYEKLIDFLQESSENATTEDGVWKLPDGDEFYQYALRRNTTTELTPEEIFEIGKTEVERIRGEMKELMEQVGFEGDLQAFYEYLREDPKFYYPDTEEGRQAYISRAEAILDSMKTLLPRIFNTLPEAELVVKPVEPFREKSSPAAFYQSPAPDGSRPGIFYANTSDMRAMPKYEMEALAYHEGLPGHHMQIAIAQELEGIPTFRRLGNYTAYAEGWGLYSELLPKEMGLYENSYSDFGRLTMEMWRACRLVLDVGIHYKKWTREEAIDYLCTNTPNAQEDCRREIERYIVYPGQATSYKTGMLKILEIRDFARQELGEDFDISRFHDAILTDGALPLDILEENMQNWIEKEKQQEELSGSK